VIDKIGLRIIARILPYDLDRLFVGADGAVRAEPVEDRAKDIVRLDRERRIVLQTWRGDVVLNTDGEMILRRWLLQVVEGSFDHCRSELLRRQTISPTDDPQIGAGVRCLLKRGDAIEVERFAGTTRFLGTIQYGN